MDDQQKSSKSAGSLSIGMLSKTLILIRRNFGKPQEPAIDFLTKNQSFNLSNKSDLKNFLFLLKKPNKTKQEEQNISDTLKIFPFFEKMDPKVSSFLLQGFSEYFQYIYRPAGSTIYETGEDGDYLYIILTGIVYTLISKSGLMPSEYKEYHNKSGNESPKKENSPSLSPANKIPQNEEGSKFGESPQKINLGNIGRRSSFFVKASGFESINQEIERRSISKKNDNLNQRVLKIINLKYPEYFIAQEMKSGESFGEVALITNSKRNEICVCKENCHFLRIDKKNYKKILMLNHARELRELVDFFSKFDIFSHWPRSQLSTFMKFFQVNSFSNNDVLYKENDESNFLYFIKEGEVEVFFFLKNRVLLKYCLDFKDCAFRRT